MLRIRKRVVRYLEEIRRKECLENLIVTGYNNGLKNKDEQWITDLTGLCK